MPLYLKNILIFVYMSLKGKYCNTQEGKTLYLHLHRAHSQHIQVHIHITCIHVYTCKHIWTLVFMSLCGLFVMV